MCSVCGPEVHDKLHLIKFIIKIYAVNCIEIKRHMKFHKQQLFIFNLTQRLKKSRVAHSEILKVREKLKKKKSVH